MRAVAVAVLLAAPFLLAGLGAAPLDDPGEGMHAEIARELARSGDPFDLRLGGVRYVDKPPLLYALLATATTLAGPSEAAARLAPALAALTAVAATAWLATRLRGPGAGLLAGVALLSAPGFYAFARYVRPETLFAAAIALGLALVLVGLERERRALVVAGLAAFGVAALAKDPLGLLAPPLAVGLALGLGGRARPVGRWLPPVGVAVAATLGLGWWLLTEARTSGFVWYTVVDNHLLNVARLRHFPDEDVPLGAPAFLAVALLGAAPWSLSAGVSMAGLVRRRAWRNPVELPWVVLALWVAGVLGATLLSRFRLPHYGLPAYPALVILAARAWTDHGGRPFVAAHAILLGSLGAACLAAWLTGASGFVDLVGAATDVATRKGAVAGQGAPLPAWEALGPLVGATGAVLTAGGLALALVACLGPGLRRLAPVVVALTALGLLPGVGLALGRVAEHRSVRPVAELLARQAAATDVVAHEGPLENSGALEWYSGRRAVIVDGQRSVLGFGARAEEARDVFWEPSRLEQAWTGPGRVWLVTTREPARSLATRLPGARLVAASGTRWLWTNH